MSDNPRQERIEAAAKAWEVWHNTTRASAKEILTASDRVLWRLVRKWRKTPPTIGEKQLGVKPRSELYADELAALLLGENSDDR